MDDDKGNEDREVMTEHREGKREKEEEVSEIQITAEDASIVVESWFILRYCEESVVAVDWKRKGIQQD